MKKILSKFINRTIVVVLLIIPIFLGLAILMRFLSPFGLSVKYDFNIADNAELFGKIRDVDRTSEAIVTNDSLIIKDRFDVTKEKVEFSISPVSKDFKEIQFRIGLGQVNTSTIMVQVNNFKDKNTENHLIYNKELATLGKPKYKYNDFSIWPFNSSYKNITSLEFSVDRLAESSYSIPVCTMGNSFRLEPKISGTVSFETPKTFKHVLRGTHNFSTYVGPDRLLYFSFDKQDLNWYSGIDTVNVQLTKGDVVLRNEIIADDGVYDGVFGRPLGDKSTYTIDMQDLDQGVYQIDIITNEDVLLSSISTKNAKLVVNKDIFLANNSIYGVSDEISSVSTYAPRLFITSYHDTANQPIYVNGENFSLQDLQNYETFELKTSELNEIVFTKSDVRMSSKDYYSFDAESYFKPTVVDEISCLSFTKDVIIKQDILAVKNYNVVEKEGQYTVTIPFNEGFIGPDNRIYFTLYSPGLGIDESKVEIKNLSIEITK